MKRAFLISARSSIGLITLWATSAWALSVAPARTDVRLDPGAATRVVLTVTNTTSEKRVIQLTTKPWFKYPDNQNLRVEDWLKLPKKIKFSLKPGKSKEVTVKLECPKDAVGELMGMVSFAAEPEKGSMLTSMVSTPIYMRVIGTEKNTGNLLNLGAGTRQGVFQVGAQIEATGNVRLRPVGIIQLLDAKGNAIGDYVMPEATPIFPGQTRDCVANGPAAPPAAGKYTLKAHLTSGSLEIVGESRIRVRPNGEVELEK